MSQTDQETDSENFKKIFRGAVEISPKYFDELIRSIEQVKRENAECNSAQTLKLEFPQGLITKVRVVLIDGTIARLEY